MARTARGKTAGKTGAGATRKPGRKRTAASKPEGPWGALTLAMLAFVLILRLAVNATEPFPVSYGEAQYWVYGQELAWGYYSEQPLVAWIVRAVTDTGGDGVFVLRAISPLAHGLTGWLIFLTGKRLWSGATGFWAAAGYTAAPGVSFSAMTLSVEPVLLCIWAGALYAFVRAAEAEGRLWWIALGALVGAGILADGIMIAFAAAALLYGLFSARERVWTGAGMAALAALIVTGPNLVWNVAQDASIFGHYTSAAHAGEEDFDLLRLIQFSVAQLAVMGPVFLIAIWLAFKDRKSWIDDWGMRLIAWQTAPLLAGIIVLSAMVQVDLAWAAPAYVGGALLAARWLVTSNGGPALKAQLGIGVAAAMGLWTVTGLYSGQADDLTRKLDPFKHTRVSAEFCELALGTMAEEGAEVLLSDDRRRLSECMYYGGLSWDEVAIWNPAGRPKNHHELTASLQPGDARPMLLMVHDGAAAIARQFSDAREIDAGMIETHKDRSVPFQIWSLQGFKGY